MTAVDVLFPTVVSVATAASQEQAHQEGPCKTAPHCLDSEVSGAASRFPMILSARKTCTVLT